MRTDVANLLERLGKREFHYQEFADRFADVELWPLFETLIRDPRILIPTTAEPVAAAAKVSPAPAPQAEHASAAPGPAPAPTAPADLAALFARYGGAPEETPSDVHALLQKLAQQLEQGKL